MLKLSSFETTQVFVWAVLSYIGAAAETNYNACSDLERLSALVQNVEQMHRSDLVSCEHDAAAYGLNRAIRSGRANSYATVAVYHLNFRALCELVHELACHVEHGEFAAFLNIKYTPKEVMEPYV